MTHNLEPFKQQAAERALDGVESGMRLGLGTGSTARYVVEGLAARLRDGRLRDIVGVPTSEATAKLAGSLGIPLATLDQQHELDLVIDGADEIDPQLNLIKGLGGALLREKIVASVGQRFCIVADTSKVVGRLGEHTPVPVEVISFGMRPVEQRLRALGCAPVLRRNASGLPFITDEGNSILDCRFEQIDDPERLDADIHAIPGVVEHGLFIGMASVAFAAGLDGVTRLQRSR
ncbi:ribose-5-phosphate isomerase RpiA [Chloroflexia bacterium SDU3-3]|nr:ribose-5-phosphate isomerase RpiA [Chloroflexia bacterium SDU3-3]